MFEHILHWYSGKALDKIVTSVLPTLQEAEKLGYWPPKTSRSVCAALNKQSVAQRFARKHDPHNHDANEFAAIKQGKQNGYYLGHAMMFGLFQMAPGNVELAEQLRPGVTKEQEEVFSTALQWAQDFAPVAELVQLLNDTRPRPVYVMATLSPTVFRNVGLAMGLKLDTIRMPEIKWTWITVMIKGKECRMSFGEILWPKGTKHGCSRYARGTADNRQCHSCGHAIKNAYNWVPLVAAAKGGPLSLWVGRDCAERLFGCKVDGDAIYKKES